MLSANMSVNLSCPMGNWVERGTVIPTAGGRKTVDEYQAKQVVRKALVSLPAAVQKEIERCLASGDTPDETALKLMGKVITREG